MARRSSKGVTYDSRETHTVLGLFCLLVGIFFLISLFTISESPGSLFLRTKELFGQSTILTSFFLVSLGLYFLGAKLPFTKQYSLLGQLALVFLIPAFLTSFTSTTSELDKVGSSTVAGGHVGYYIVKEIFGNQFPTEPATKFILLAAVLIFVPIAFSLSISNIVERIMIVINFFAVGFRTLFIDAGDNIDEEDRSPKNSNKAAKEMAEKASTYGDFNMLVGKKAQDAKKAEEKTKKSDDFNFGSLIRDKKPASEVQVEIKEGNMGEVGLQQDDLKYPGWKLPPLNLLIPYQKGKTKEDNFEEKAKIIQKTLASFDVPATVEDAFIGPSVVQYALSIPLGINVAKVNNLSANLALALGVDSTAIRIEPIPDTTYLGVEVPRTKRDMVRFKELMEADNMQQTKFKLPITIGKDIDGDPVVADLVRMPHLLIAGATGSGKSVLTNNFISSLIMKKTPDELKMILVDPKRVELVDYNGIPHLLTPVITEMEKVVNALKWAVGEMDRRYHALEQEVVRNIEGYNDKKGFSAMPYIVIVIDEMADMMMTANRVDAETAIVRLAQKARAVGIHLILATQRPSVNVITGIIKANIPGRIAMSVTSTTDSRVILDKGGAESLMGRGDMLYKAPDSPKVTRLQGSNIEQDEIGRVVDFLKSQAPEVEYVTEILEKQLSPEEMNAEALADISGDNMMEQAIRVVVNSQKGSASYLQRRLNVGFNRAARLLEELEEIGVVGPTNGAKAREVLVRDADEFIASLKAQ